MPTRVGKIDRIAVAVRIPVCSDAGDGGIPPIALGEQAQDLAILLREEGIVIDHIISAAVGQGMTEVLRDLRRRIRAEREAEAAAGVEKVAWTP